MCSKVCAKTKSLRKDGIEYSMRSPGKSRMIWLLTRDHADNQKEVPKAPPSNKFSINLVSTKIKTPLEAILKGFSEVPSAQP